VSDHCVINERRTNEELPGPDRARPDGGLHVMSWCGTKRCTRVDWLFLDAAHVLASLEAESSVTPCRACLRAMLDVLASELNSR
jgi:hypothetical protein